MEISLRHLILMFTVLLSWTSMARPVVDEDKPREADSHQIPRPVAEVIDQLDKCAQRLYPGSKIDQGALYNRFADPGGAKDVADLCYRKTMTRISSLTNQEMPILQKAIRDRDLKRTASLIETPFVNSDGNGGGSR